MRSASKAFAAGLETKEIHERYRRNQAPENAVAEEDGDFHRQAKLQPWPHQGGGGREKAHAWGTRAQGGGKACSRREGRVRAGRRSGQARRESRAVARWRGVAPAFG